MILKRVGCIATLFFSVPIVLLFGYHEHGYQYLYPKPDSEYVSSGTTLIIRFEALSPECVQNMASFIYISGEQSGIHPGKTKIASDQKTIIFTPDSPFIPEEMVTVSLQPVINSSHKIVIKPFTYQFRVIEFISPGTVEEEMDDTALGSSIPSTRPLSTRAMVMPNGVSVPSDFPHVEITVNDNPCTDYIFIDNRGGGPGRPYNVIFDNTGSPVWYMHTGGERRDFKVQPNGWITMMIRGADGYGHGEGFIAFDENFNFIKEFYAVRGNSPYRVSTDEHELQVLEDGGYLLIALRWISYDCRPWGGHSNATIGETGIQEFTAEDELIFQWWAIDDGGFIVGDVELTNVRSSSFRFPHMNSLDIDEDGHIILSNRLLSEVTKINRQTGEKIWRLGGAHNQFTFVDDPLDGQKNQHAVRALGGGRYSIFDNGNGHNPSVSRAVIYQLDTDQMTATLEWEYREFGWYTDYMGNAQLLPNGNMLINWVQNPLPKLTEIRPDGSMAFRMNFVYPSHCYRVHRCPWNGMVEEPVLDIEMELDNVTLLMNKFGDPDVDHYNIYAGRGQNPTTLHTTSSTSLKHIYDLENGYHWIRVTAVNGSGQESGYSNQEQVYVNFSSPGANLVTNGDFSNGQNDWTWELQGTGAADWSIEDGAAYIDIANGGSNVYDVQLRQNGIPLITGTTYVFEFDARAEGSRTIEAKVGQDNSPYTNYSGLTSTFLTPAEQHFSYEFQMESPSDGNSRVVFNMGQSNMNVTIDNVSVGQKVEQSSFIGSPHAVPGMIQCEEYDLGGEGIAYHDDDRRDGDLDYRPDDAVDTQQSSDVDGGYNVGWTEAGEWLEYTVNAEPGIYDIEYRTASDPGGGELEIILDGETLTTFNMSSTGDWQTYETKTKSGIEIEGGENLVLRLSIIEGDQNMNWLRFINTTNVQNVDKSVPLDYALHQNYPNPFNPETRIEYQLPNTNHVLIQVFNVLGTPVRTLVNEKQIQGRHHVAWDGLNEQGIQEASGVYLVSMQAGAFRSIRKITLLR